MVAKFSTPADNDKPLPSDETLPPFQSTVSVPDVVMMPPWMPPVVAIPVTVPPPEGAVRVPLLSVIPVPIAVTVPAFQTFVSTL
jgi:hypothetical protein